jgi:hypothetical protein
MIQTFIAGFLAQIGKSDFVVDPKGTVRVIPYYPLELDRNMNEILRTMKGLQTADKEYAIPANTVDAIKKEENKNKQERYSASTGGYAIGSYRRSIAELHPRINSLNLKACG